MKLRSLFALSAILALPTSLLAKGEEIFYAPHLGVPITSSEFQAKRAGKSATLIEDNFGTEIGFSIHYMDPNGVGFLDATHGVNRREVLRAVLTYVDEVFDHDSGGGEVRVEVETDDTIAPLGFGGTFFPEADGFHSGSAFNAILNGRNPLSANPEIFITMRFDANWNNTLDDPAPTELDLFSVLLHEVTHALGIINLSGENGESVFAPSKSFTTFEELLFDTVSSSNSWDASQNFTGDSFTGGNNTVEFRGTSAFAAFGSVFPPVYTPATFQEGSSIGHWQDSTPIPAEAVMTPATSSGAKTRELLPFELGALEDLGYTLSANRVDPASWMIMN